MTVQELDALPIGTKVVVKDYHNIELAPYYAGNDIDRSGGFEAASSTNGGLTFVQPVMGDLGGKVARILSHTKSDRVHLQFEDDEDNEDQKGLYWCASMLDIYCSPQISAKAFQEIMQ